MLPLIQVGGGSGGASTPTGTGFPHITSGVQDAAARAVNLASADVTGVLPPANGGVAEILSAGLGMTSVPACDPSYGQLLNNTTVGLNTTNTIPVYQFVLPFQITIGHITMDISATSAGAGSHAFFGIYNAAGTSLLVEGVFDASSATVQSVVPTGGAVTLNPGVYWWAYGGDTATSITCRNALVVSTGFSDSMNKSTLRVCKAGNVISGGHLPSSLGTLTATIANCAVGFVEP